MAAAKIKFLLLFLVPLVILTAVVVNKNSIFQKVATQAPVQTSQENSPETPDVLGRSYQSPQIYINGGEARYSSGGVISLASTDEPAVQIGGYNISGDAEISVYQADESLLLNYLIHDKDAKQTQSNPDVSKLQFVTRVNHQINTSTYEGSKVALPLAERGIWYLSVKIGQTQADAVVIRSGLGVLAKEGDNELILWGQDFKSKRSINNGVARVLDLQDSVKELQSVGFDDSGLARINISANVDVVMVSRDGDVALVPVNLRYLNSGYSYRQFTLKDKLTRYFIFSDRPLYKPGDVVNFKSVLRDDDDARYSIPGGEATVKIFNGYYYFGQDTKPIYEQKIGISTDGTISGKYQLPQDAKVGYYSMVVSVPGSGAQNSWGSEWTSNTIYFDVQYFRKPEFSIDVTSAKSDVIAGDKTSFKIKGSYFSGQPLAGQKVKYTVYSSDYYEYQYVMDQQYYNSELSNDYRYSYWYGSNKALEGTADLNSNGEAEIQLDTKTNFNNGRTQVFSIEAALDDGSQNPSFARRNMLVYAGDYGIYRRDYSYGDKVNTPISIPVTLLPNRANLGVRGITLNAKIHREDWVAYNDPAFKYPQYRKVEEDLPGITAKTDSSGNASLAFTPTKTGSYRITVESTDSRNNLVSKIFYMYITDHDYPAYTDYGNNELTISADKQKYQPSDTAKLSIFSTIPDRDIFLSLERGRVNRFQIVHLDGKNGTVDLPLENTDIPNIYAQVESFSASALDTNILNIPVSSESKKLKVNITPDKTTYGPADTVTVNIATTDVQGNPASADVAIWAVDKAIFELSDNRLGNIFDTFWRERSNLTQQAHSLEGIVVNGAEGGGCFAAGTQVLMADGTTKSIEEIHVGDYVSSRSQSDNKLTKARVLKTYTAQENGYLVINSHLKVTSNHLMWIDGRWQQAGNIQVGSIMTDAEGRSVPVTSIEWVIGDFTVYNLEIETYHTYFANGIWVHNDKGITRNAFKDTAYWNPSVHTDSAGRARITFKLPDNLTTWTIAAVGATSDTRVGQTTSEIVVSKDIVIRPIIPNILRIDDQVVLSALVQNFTTQPQTFETNLEFDAGEVVSGQKASVTLNASQTQQIYWQIKPTKENEKAKLVFSIKSKSDSKLADIVTQVLPVRAFGFTEKTAESGEGDKNFTVNLAPDSDPDKSGAVLSLSPTLLGSLPSAMEYLIGYPYGCVEQTTSRFVPAVIAKQNQQLFAQSLQNKDLDGIIKAGLTRLSSMQQSDGGWTWWYTGASSPYVTAYVTEYLLMARDTGIPVDEQMLSQAKNYLEHSQTDSDNRVVSLYALSLFDEKSGSNIGNFDNMDADILSRAVMSNYRNGNTNSQTNGLARLEKMAVVQGDGVFWPAGSKANFGSQDASTALAIRAILVADGDRDLAAKAARYLTRNRRFDYWSSTFATTQVIQSMVELYYSDGESNPNYTYTVSVDGNKIATGRVTSSKQFVKDIVIPGSKLKSGSTVSVTKTGTGQVYSTLRAFNFHTDRKSPAVNHGLIIEREYVNTRGIGYSLAVGDIVEVHLRIGGLASEENYGVIQDELPSGLVPINENFNNEQYQDPNIQSAYQYAGQEVTENGMVLSLYTVYPGDHTYSYKARVVSEGEFIAPPATVSLMYAPEIYARTTVQTVNIDKTSVFTPQDLVRQVNSAPTAVKLAAAGLIILLTLGISTVLAIRKRKKLVQ
jgi:alpha-2-macroglobulin